MNLIPKFIRRRIILKEIRHQMDLHSEITGECTREIHEITDRIFELDRRIGSLRELLDQHLRSGAPQVLVDNVRWNLCNASDEFERLSERMNTIARIERKRLDALTKKVSDLHRQLEELR